MVVFEPTERETLHVFFKGKPMHIVALVAARRQ
jgi:hypothetical protein